MVQETNLGWQEGNRCSSDPEMESPEFSDRPDLGSEHHAQDGSGLMLESLTKKGNVGKGVGLGGGVERINHSVFSFEYFCFEAPEENRGK